MSFYGIFIVFICFSMGTLDAMMRRVLPSAFLQVRATPKLRRLQAVAMPRKLCLRSASLSGMIADLERMEVDLDPANIKVVAEFWQDCLKMHKNESDAVACAWRLLYANNKVLSEKMVKELRAKQKLASI